MTTRIVCLLVSAGVASAAPVSVKGLEQPVEILRDKWGVPHIYAKSQHDLFVAQGYVTAKDRLFQIDIWRRIGTGQLAEALGEKMTDRDRMARALKYRGDMDAEWRAYSADTRDIATAFTAGINAYIASLKGKRPAEFAAAGFDPGLWKPEDVLTRVAGILLSRNVGQEIERAMNVAKYGVDAVQRFQPPDPYIKLDPPKELDLSEFTKDIVKVYDQVRDDVHVAAESAGSNNWVIDGTLSATGKPLLANDPHRPILIPSLRKTWHLVAPGWNAIGAGEPALPGIALGHNERIAWGFTTIAMDQQDLYVEKLNPANANQYWFKGEWRSVEIERVAIRVKGRAEAASAELRYTAHGPILYENRAKGHAYALRTIHAEAGAAGYLNGIAIARAGNWNEFQKALEHYYAPAQNIVYADVDGNIGYQATGLNPIREGFSGLFPLPGDSGAYEWSGFRKIADLPRSFNPAEHFVATSNHNILPAGYPYAIGYYFAKYRIDRVREMLLEKTKLSVADFERMQHDVNSVAARQFVEAIQGWKNAPPAAVEVMKWDGRMTADSRAAAIYEAWLFELKKAVHPLAEIPVLIEEVRGGGREKELAVSLEAALKRIGDKRWGDLHTIAFKHPVDSKAFHRGPFARPGDANTVYATGGAADKFPQTSGASYRQIMDLSDWDKSVVTNAPGESGDPASKWYDNLTRDWLAGRYHPLPYSRKAVEAAVAERIELRPAGR